MGDRLQAGEPSRYVASHPGQLSLAIPPWVGTMRGTCNILRGFLQCQYIIRTCSNILYIVTRLRTSILVFIIFFSNIIHFLCAHTYAFLSNRTIF